MGIHLFWLVRLSHDGTVPIGVGGLGQVHVVKAEAAVAAVLVVQRAATQGSVGVTAVAARVAHAALGPVVARADAAVVTPVDVHVDMFGCILSMNICTKYVFTWERSRAVRTGRAFEVGHGVSTNAVVYHIV